MKGYKVTKKDLEQKGLSTPRKPSAASLESIRWRTFFTEFAAALLNHHGIETSATDSHYHIILNESALLADKALQHFYSRYEKEKD